MSAEQVPNVTMPDKAEIAEIGASLWPIVKEIVDRGSIGSIDEHASVLAAMIDVRQRRRRMLDRINPGVEQAHRLHKWMTSYRNEESVPYDQADDALGALANEWETKQRRIAIERQRQLEEQARKDEEERQLQDAIAAEQAGDKETAEAILTEPTFVPVVHVAPAVAQVAGVGSSVRWHAEITDAWELIKWVAADKTRLCYLEVDALMRSHPNLNRLAVSQRSAMAIPGVKAVPETTRSVRTA